LYLTVVLDLYSRQMIGWSMDERNKAELVSNALRMALWRRGQVKGVIVHSDQGSTYASRDYRQLLAENGLLCSMSRKGDCFDNAVAESFFGYIEIFYNRQRRHSFLNYMTPVDHEKKHVYNF